MDYKSLLLVLGIDLAIDSVRNVAGLVLFDHLNDLSQLLLNLESLCQRPPWAGIKGVSHRLHRICIRVHDTKNIEEHDGV